MTLLELVASLMVAACVGASAYRLWAVAQVFGVDPQAVAKVLKAGAPPADVARALRAEGAIFDAELVEAADPAQHENGASVVGAVNEVLLEVDDRLQRWARVPRVAVSVASSSGFLLASLAMRRGLADTDLLAPELRESFLFCALGDAVGAAALGLCGAVACVALHARARDMRRARAAGVSAVVNELAS